MPHVDSHNPGEFCWLELATTDENGAKAFYRDLFGWSVREIPAEAGASYSIFNLNGRDAAGAFAMRPEDLSRAIPPHWHLYIAVENVDETSAKAATLGGKILESPFDVSRVGTISVIRDPTGTVFSIFRASGQTGWGIIGEPGSFCRADLITRDPERAERFYSDLLGWEIVGSRQDRSDYLQIHNRGRFIGGIPHPRHQGTNSPPHWLSYFCVSDVDEAAGKASSLGGKIWGVPMDVDDFGRMAIVADPQGAAFALFNSRSS